MKTALKENEKFCYVHRQYAQPSYTYSMQDIDLIVDEVMKDSENIVENRKTKKINCPQGYRNSWFTPAPIREPNFIHYELVYSQYSIYRGRVNYVIKIYH